MTPNGPREVGYSPLLKDDDRVPFLLYETKALWPPSSHLLFLYTINQPVRRCHLFSITLTQTLLMMCVDAYSFYHFECVILQIVLHDKVTTV